ncbi:uncharacterized protein [Symphalangus syndactylus]|uniref:uncharacterized protein n=1 Tax=Symphalangus syndactylus TaxID=9590 RepID=UPI00300749AA
MLGLSLGEVKALESPELGRSRLAPGFLLVSVQKIQRPMQQMGRRQQPGGQYFEKCWILGMSQRLVKWAAFPWAGDRSQERGNSMVPPHWVQLLGMQRRLTWDGKAGRGSAGGKITRSLSKECEMESRCVCSSGPCLGESIPRSAAHSSPSTPTRISSLALSSPACVSVSLSLLPLPIAIRTSAKLCPSSP